jgi:SAM-dependent methyltransferase
VGGLTTHASLAQTVSQSAEHQDLGDHLSHRRVGQSDGAFHRRFEDPEKWAKEFDNPERDAWQKPEEILDGLHLTRTSIVADIGAGTGCFTVRIARRIPEGKVFAADIEPDMVRYLGERSRREHLTNVIPVLASADGANLPEAVDAVLVVDTYHHIGNRIQYFTKLKSSMRQRVERSLYHRANGYNYEAVKIFMPAGHNKPVYAPYIEHVPPDVTACIFWLKNRDPQHWRDSQQLEHVLGKYIISDKPMTEEEWARERADVIDAEPQFGEGREELHRDAASHGLPKTAPTPQKVR